MEYINSASIILTEDCNMDCTFCYEKGKSLAVMDGGTVIKTLDFIFANCKDKLFLYWFGGEPLLNFSTFCTGVNHAKKIAKDKNVELRMRIPTNGTIWDGGIEQFFKENPDINLQISWQGLAELQNAERGSAEIVETNAMRICENLKNPLDVQIQLNPRYVHKIKEAVDYVVEKTKGRATIMLRPTPEMNGWLEPGVLGELYKQVFSCCETHGRLIKRLAQCENGEIEQNSFCKAGRNFCSVTPSGDIYPCHRFYFGQRNDNGERFKLGSIYDGFKPTDIAGMFKQCERDSIVGCESCPGYSVCYLCLACNYEMTGNFIVPSRQNCEVNRAYSLGILDSLQKSRVVSQDAPIHIEQSEDIDPKEALLMLMPLFINQNDTINFLVDRVKKLEAKTKFIGKSF